MLSLVNKAAADSVLIMRRLLDSAAHGTAEFVRRSGESTDAALVGLRSIDGNGTGTQRLLLNDPYDAEPCERAMLGDLDPVRRKAFTHPYRDALCNVVVICTAYQ